MSTIPIAGTDEALASYAAYLQRPKTDFDLPYLSVTGGEMFEWPLGVQGFDITHEASLGVHRYIGDIYLDVDVLHRDQNTIQLTGNFVGEEASAHMIALSQVFERETIPPGKVLYLPGVLNNLQFVVCQTLNFNHGRDDPDEITYTLSMIRAGVGGAVAAPARDAFRIPISDSSAAIAPVGDSAYQYTTTDSVNNLRSISLTVFGTSDRWPDLYTMNQRKMNELGVQAWDIPTYRFPAGTKINY